MRKIAKVTLDELNENVYMDNVNLDAELSSVCNQFVSELQSVEHCHSQGKGKTVKRKGNIMV